MDDNIAIKVENISKTFHEQMGSRTLKQAFVSAGRGLIGKKEKKLNKGDFTALKDINFEVKKGEFFGIIGRNGCGKSTLLKIIAGVYSPTVGAVTLNGNLTPFIELGVGFNPELSGRDNVYLNGALLGFSKKQMEAMYDDIVSFAELEEFMDVKLKNYSSGMQVRLAFSVAIRADSDILLIDEVLAVGDAIFQQKCFTYFEKLKKDKKTVVFVSHDTGALRRYCDKGILIDDSKIIYASSMNKVVNEYLDVLNNIENKETVKDSDNIKKGNRKVKVQSVKLNNTLYTEKDEFIEIKVEYVAGADVDNPVYGITVNNSAGINVFDSNTLWSYMKTKRLIKGDTAVAKWIIPNVFNSGNYTISPAVANKSGLEMYEWVQDMKSFKIRKSEEATSIINIKHKIIINNS